MKKRMFLLITAVLLTILTACGMNPSHEGSGVEVENERPESETGVNGTESGTRESAENAESAEHEYELMSITYSEPVEGFSFRRNMEKTQTDYASYYFEPSVSRQERDACIEITDSVISCIDAPQPHLEVVVLKQESYDGVSVSGNRLYLSLRPWNCVDYVAKVLLAGYGEWGNYGLAYGYADYLCKKAGLDKGESGSEGQEADGLLQVSASERYDLNLLCFDEKFVSAEDVKASKHNACLFVEDYLSSHSEQEFLELLAASGTVEGVVQAKEALEAFYAKKGVECSLTEIRYQLGGVAFDFGAACEYAHFYIEKDWQDEAWAWNPMVSENFLHEDYGQVREFFECNRQQMRQYQELFGFDSYNNDLPIAFTNSRVLVGRLTSIYLGDHQIRLKVVSSLMHEYIHSVMNGRFDEWDTLWKTEGFARYFSYKYDAYAYDFLNNYWNDESIIWVQEYIDFLGRPIDVRTDVPELWDILVHGYGYTDPNSGYESGASFIGYLVDQYGEQAVISYVCSDSEYNEEWEKTYDELVQDWNQYIEENYSQYSMNSMQWQ